MNPDELLARLDERVTALEHQADKLNDLRQSAIARVAALEAELNERVGAERRLRQITTTALSILGVLLSAAAIAQWFFR
jgi:hypothetical protein